MIAISSANLFSKICFYPFFVSFNPEFFNISDAPYRNYSLFMFFSYLSADSFFSSFWFSNYRFSSSIFPIFLIILICISVTFSFNCDTFSVNFSTFLSFKLQSCLWQNAVGPFIDYNIESVIIDGVISVYLCIKKLVPSFSGYGMLSSNSSTLYLMLP